MQHRKTMTIGQGLALAGILQLAVLSQPASADAYRCKGNCYAGTRQLYEKCESRVATMRLNSAVKRHYRGGGGR